MSKIQLKTLHKFCRNPTKLNFDLLPIETKNFFYKSSIQVILHKIGKRDIANSILYFYDRLLFSVGIYDRTYMLGQMNIPIDTFLPDDVNGQMKKYFIREIIDKYNVKRNTVYFYDDKYYNIKTTALLGINSVLVKGGINPVEFKNLLSRQVSVVLLDFDNTLTVSKIRKTDYSKDTEYLVKNFLGGRERIDSIFNTLRKLEQKGVKIGIITMNVKHRILPFLQKINWIF